MFESSGKFLNDLGKYIDCLNLEGTKYFLVK